MNEKEPNSMQQLDAETIAALIDGRLSGEERARILERLAIADEAEVAAFTDAVLLASMLDGTADAATTPDDSVVSIASARRRPRLRFALAAAAVVLLAATSILMLVRRAPDQPAMQLAAALDAGAVNVEGWDQLPWRVVRSGATAAADGQLAFRIGVRLALLAAAERSGDTAARSTAAREVSALAEQLPAGAAYAEIYRSLETAAIDERQRERLHADGWAALTTALPETELRLGVWTGAARLALLAGDFAWFSDGAAREIRSMIDASALAPDTREAWTALLQAIDSGDTAGARARIDSLTRTAGG